MAKKWIQKAVKNKGSLIRSAKRAHAIKKGGGIKVSWLNKMAKKGGIIGRRARLAKIFRKMHR